MPHHFFRASVPRLFAHRGGSALGPENTLAAFDRGLAAGADGLELDVRLSRDGVVVVHHDATLNRTTNLSGPVAAVRADELERADAAWWFGESGGFFLRGCEIGVPRLSAVLARYPGALVIIELKTGDAALADAVVVAVREAGAFDRVCLGSFSSSALRRVRAAAPELATSAAREEVRWALYRSWCGWTPRAPIPYDGFQVPERAGRTRVVSPRFVRVAHEAGLGVHVWTVNDEADARRLLEWGVDGLISDRPDTIRRLMPRSDS